MSHLISRLPRVRRPVSIVASASADGAVYGKDPRVILCRKPRAVDVDGPGASAVLNAGGEIC